MSSTRHATGGEFNPERYASAAEFERGLNGSLVARRCSVLDDPEHRKLIWFLHFLSHKPGGLKTVATALIAEFSEKVATSSMLEFGKRSGQYNSDQVREVRKQLPRNMWKRFPLRGEILSDFDPLASQAKHACNLRALADSLSGFHATKDSVSALFDGTAEKEAKERAGHPASYPVDNFLSICRAAAETNLAGELHRLCLDPSFELPLGAPWYFAALADTLQSYFTEWITRRSASLVITQIGVKVVDTLEYTLQSRSLTLIEGDARIGKTFAARSWCDTHPGEARFVEVPTGNDDVGFFRALARGLGLGSFTQYKSVEIRERVESVLLTGNILLCLDEAHRLWPQTEIRRGFPKRINWIMSMANQGVPICLISTPQFLRTLKAREEQTGWNSAQLQGRLGHYEPLPRELSTEDLIAVAKAQLPESDAKTLRSLAAYARTSARYLAAIETITKRARFIAMRSGRDKSDANDVRRAMKESVIPADSKLVCSLQPQSQRQERRRSSFMQEPEFSDNGNPENPPRLSNRGTATEQQPDSQLAL